MVYSQDAEQWGGSVRYSLAASQPLPLPYGPGGARMIAVEATASGVFVTLPDAAAFLAAGGRPQFVVLLEPTSPKGLEIRDAGGGSVATLLAGQAIAVYLRDASSAAGLWTTRLYSTLSVSSALATGRQALEYRFASPILYDWSLSDYASRFGWDGVSPVALRVAIGANAIMASTTTGPALTTGSFPAGSTLLLHIEPGAYITGRGGAGGRGGGGGLLAQPGSAGGHALELLMDTWLINEGIIGGGGGGGGGGAASGSTGGGGGGGGAGLIAAQGGAGGGSGSQYGVSGTLGVAGGGGAGATPGGTGGAPGQPGDASSGGGGAAGDAVRYLSTITYTKLTAGTILGAEVAI